MSNEDPIKRFRELLSVSPDDRATGMRISEMTEFGERISLGGEV